MNWYKRIKISSAIEMLPTNTKDSFESETGREARGKAPCPECGTICTVSTCSDVNGIWWYCPKCGLVDH